jgi:hypothetical protein
MNAAMVNRIVSLIPERVARLSSGVAFAPGASACRYPERVAYLAQFLNWMSPLNPITKDDQRVLGLRNENGRPVHAADLEDDELPEPGEEQDAPEAEEVEAAEEAEELDATEETELEAAEETEALEVAEATDELEQAEEVLA